MSRTRREKDPDALCWAEWPAEGPGCPHVCRRPLDHDGEHRCCIAPGGIIAADEV